MAGLDNSSLPDCYYIQPAGSLSFLFQGTFHNLEAALRSTDLVQSLQLGGSLGVKSVNTNQITRVSLSDEILDLLDPIAFLET